MSATAEATSSIARPFSHTQSQALEITKPKESVSGDLKTLKILRHSESLPPLCGCIMWDDLVPIPYPGKYYLLALNTFLFVCFFTSVAWKSQHSDGRELNPILAHLASTILLADFQLQHLYY